MLYIRHIIRTQVYLPEELHTDIRLTAAQEKKPAAEIIRETIRIGLAKKAQKMNAGQALLRLAKLGEQLKVKGPKDLSINHDKYLYGEG